MYRGCRIARGVAGKPMGAEVVEVPPYLIIASGSTVALRRDIGGMKLYGLSLNSVCDRGLSLGLPNESAPGDGMAGAEGRLANDIRRSSSSFAASCFLVNNSGRRLGAGTSSVSLTSCGSADASAMDTPSVSALCLGRRLKDLFWRVRLAALLD